jgi:hypothetical protein
MTVPEKSSLQSRRRPWWFLTTGIISALFLTGCCNRAQLDGEASKRALSPELHDKLTQKWAEQGDYRMQTHLFLKRIQAKNCPEELLDWAEKLLAAHRGDNQPYKVPHEEKPAFILDLEPPIEPFVTVYPKSHVSLDWGGGFGHHGLFLAKKTPPTNPLLYTIEWVPGVYAYYTTE